MLRFKTAPVTLEYNPGHGAVSSRQRPARGQFPVHRTRLERLRVKSAVNKFRPGGTPGLDHRHHPTLPYSAGCFAQEVAWPGDMMEHIGHNDAAQCLVAHGQALPIQDHINPW